MTDINLNILYCGVLGVCLATISLEVRPLVLDMDYHLAEFCGPLTFWLREREFPVLNLEPVSDYLIIFVVLHSYIK